MGVSMTSRERLLTVLGGGIPDCVPVAPDTSNMIPARLTGKPFWDLYLYNDPPVWKAYIDCVKHFGFDSVMDGYINVVFPEEKNPNAPQWERAIVYEAPDRLVVQNYRMEGGKRIWAGRVSLYPRANPPVHNVDPAKLELPAEPSWWRPVENVRQWPQGADLIAYAKEQLGDHGLVGVRCGVTQLVDSEQQIYDYYDNPNKYRERSERLVAFYEQRFHRLMNCPTPPDFLALGNSGSLIWQTPAMFRELALPILQRITELAAARGVPTHVHSCGPETELVRIAAEETQLTVIDPLEIPPMGDCNLRELKKRFGQRLVLKGNLHTTNVMLRGTPDEVRAAARQAIDDAAEGGRFILSTGDLCGRDTPDTNLQAMIETARTYGCY